MPGATLSRWTMSYFAAACLMLVAGQGHFADVEEAVARLFGAASKAKRSKIRSFALVHEELGDMLAFPEELTEKGGLRLAAGPAFYPPAPRAWPRMPAWTA